MRRVAWAFAVWLTVGAGMASATDRYECTGKVEIGYTDASGTFVAKQTMRTRTANFLLAQSPQNPKLWVMDGELQCEVDDNQVLCSGGRMELHVNLKDMHYKLTEDISWFDDADEEGDDGATTYLSQGTCVVQTLSPS